MNRITQIREGFISLNRQVDNLYSVFLKFSADLVGEKMTGDTVKDTDYNAGIFGAILNWQTNLSHRIERVHRQLEFMQDQISLQTVDLDKPMNPVHEVHDKDLDISTAFEIERRATQEARATNA